MPLEMKPEGLEELCAFQRHQIQNQNQQNGGLWPFALAATVCRADLENLLHHFHLCTSGRIITSLR